MLPHPIGRLANRCVSRRRASASQKADASLKPSDLASTVVQNCLTGSYFGAADVEQPPTRQEHPVSNPFSYAGRRVVVTGAATGVGAALLDLLAEIGGPEVTVVDIKAPSGPHARFVEADLADRDAVDAAVAAIEGPVDVLFNNAGVAATQPPRVVLAVNYLALRRLSEALLERIPAGGAIVNTASIAGGRWAEHAAEINELLDIGDWERSLEWLDANLQAVGGDSYSFSKEVVRVWGMRHSRTTMARGVRTNSVCPAPVDTPSLADFKATMGEQVIEWTAQQSSGVLMTPREVAMPLAFLGSQAAAYVNGHDLVADGGFNAAMATGQVDFSGLG
jgi:NAD(P)-dependent dehydrogenase (short-subunit alcohol dehydrogenase family)